MNRHLISIADLTRDDIERILERAESFAEVSGREIKKVPTLRGRTVINLFYESSTRTSASFEIAAKRLSADTVNIKSAGSSVDKGESPEQAARRECHEEIGQVPETIVRLGAMYPTPGYCDEEMVFFRLSNLEEPTEAAAMDEDEDIEARTFELREARDMVRRGEITDMKTVAGLAMI